MLQVNKLKTVGRAVSLAFLLATMMGPWFADSHPATEESCSRPLVWLGGGYCACLIAQRICGKYLIWPRWDVASLPAASAACSQYPASPPVRRAPVALRACH